MIEFGHGTHVGLRRTRNEDTYYADASIGLFLVADGMGGHQHGEVASARVRDRVTDLVLQKHGLADAIRDAGKDLYEHARSVNEPLPMGTTIASLQLDSDGYEVAWVGDSRIYLWHSGRLKQISHDHSLVQELVAAGRLAPEQASVHPQRNVVTQALGITASDQLHVGMARGRLEVGMRFLVCSDGLTEEVGDDRLGQLIARNDISAQECVDHLLVAALDAAGKDNITAIVVRVN